MRPVHSLTPEMLRLPCVERDALEVMAAQCAGIVCHPQALGVLEERFTSEDAAATISPLGDRLIQHVMQRFA
ncbi:hypothetical protein [Bradyrhizobium sp. DASA03120]|uniref:hypothetical protein n=1 Tax=Bradyrhizobium sp. SMVTL-02 TaxID=3395917 RepID=UPI003F6E4439